MGSTWKITSHDTHAGRDDQLTGVSSNKPISVDEDGKRGETRDEAGGELRARLRVRLQAPLVPQSDCPLRSPERKHDPSDSGVGEQQTERRKCCATALAKAT